ncbi:hypothetical protein [Clostridium butyricum]|uniref:hypothetical protein n=1 Tax=Clostridium butyricum TaxID=1492 RepID=UPI00374F5205
MEYGVYELDGFAKIDIKNNINQTDEEITGVHEVSHKWLTENTSYGMINFLITQILNSDDLPKSRKSIIIKIRNVLLKNMLQVQECFAVFMELMYTKNINKNKYANRLVEYRNNQHYYKNCKFKSIETFLQYDENIIVPIIRELACVSMDINLSEIDVINGKIDKIMENNKINPNHRFRKIIQYIKDNKMQINNIKLEDLELIYKNLNINYYKSDNDYFKIWATEKILKPLKLRKFDDYMVIKTVDNFSQYFINSISSYTSEITYTKQIITSLQELKTKNEYNKLIYIYRYVDEIYLCYLVNVDIGVMYEFKTKNLQEFINKNDQIILCDRYYYNKIIENNKYLNSYTIFVNLNGFDEFSLDFIKSNCKNKYYHFHDVNNNNKCVFIKGVNKLFLFQIFPSIITNYVYSNVLNGYKYINIEDGKMTDDIFYFRDNDWCIFEAILSFIIQRKNIIINPQEIVSLGRRIVLEDN